MDAIETQGLTRLFDGRPAVQDLALSVPTGAFYGFLGPNGAGKSTTIKMLTGLLAPSAGRARVLGVDLSRDGLDVKRRIGVVPDGLALFERLSGAEQLRIHGQLYGLERREAARRTDELLAALELAEDAGKLVGEYSHGMKKKLALGCALIHGPQLLFLDEPFEGIDAVAVAGIRRMLQDLVARGAMTIFLTSHVLEVVERLVTHVGIIRQGRLAAQGTLADVRGTGSLEEVFIRMVGEDRPPAQGLSWLGEGPV
ncbi:MAG TPA: ABC transporter ATP-binding protein [Anaeromyxobacter sp.]